MLWPRSQQVLLSSTQARWSPSEAVLPLPHAALSFPISLQGRGHLHHSHVCLCRDAIRGCTLMNAFASGPQQLLLSRRASDFLIKRPQEFFAHFAKQPPHYFAQLSPQETQVQRGQGHTVAYTQLPTHPSTSLLKKKAASRGSSHFRGPLSPWDGLEGPWTNS